MYLSKATGEEKLNLCRKYFFIGFAFLPLIWIVNCVWFFKYAFVKPAFNQQPAIRKYVVGSGIGASAWIIAIIAWTVVFQVNRASWGATGDYLSFVWPKGRA